MSQTACNYGGREVPFHFAFQFPFSFFQFPFPPANSHSNFHFPLAYFQFPFPNVISFAYAFARLCVEPSSEHAELYILAVSGVRVHIIIMGPASRNYYTCDLFPHGELNGQALARPPCLPDSLMGRLSLYTSRYNCAKETVEGPF